MFTPWFCVLPGFAEMTGQEAEWSFCRFVAHRKYQYLSWDQIWGHETGQFRHSRCGEIAKFREKWTTRSRIKKTFFYEFVFRRKSQVGSGWVMAEIKRYKKMPNAPQEILLFMRWSEKSEKPILTFVEHWSAHSTTIYPSLRNIGVPIHLRFSLLGNIRVSMLMGCVSSSSRRVVNMQDDWPLVLV